MTEDQVDNAFSGYTTQQFPGDPLMLIIPLADAKRICRELLASSARDEQQSITPDE
jgi:hypothetical protein